MTCWNDCSVQEGYSKQTLMTLINGVNEVLTGRVSFCRQCSTGIMANVSGDNYIYYTLSYGILAGVWGARQLERRVKALALFETEMCMPVFVCAHTRMHVFTPHLQQWSRGWIIVRQQHQTVVEQDACIKRQASDKQHLCSVFKHFVPGNNVTFRVTEHCVSEGAEWIKEKKQKNRDKRDMVFFGRANEVLIGKVIKYAHVYDVLWFACSVEGRETSNDH